MITEKDKELILDCIAELPSQKNNGKDFLYGIKEITAAIKTAMEHQATIAKADTCGEV
jgi:hypothetical protein